MKKNLFKIGTMILVGSTLLTGNVNAASYTTLGLNGKGNVRTNEEFTEVIAIKDIDQNKVNAVTGILEVEDDTCVTILEVNGMDDETVFTRNNKFAYASLKGTDKDLNIVTVKLRANSNKCSTKLVIKEGAAGFNNGDYISNMGDIKKEINVEEVKTTVPTTTAVKVNTTKTTTTTTKAVETTTEAKEEVVENIYFVEVEEKEVSVKISSKEDKKEEVKENGFVKFISYIISKFKSIFK